MSGCPRCDYPLSTMDVEGKTGKSMDALFHRTFEDDQTTVQFDCPGCGALLDVKISQQITVDHYVDAVEIAKSEADQKYLNAPRDPSTGRPIMF